MKRLLSARELAAEVGLSERHICDLAKDGIIPTESIVTRTTGGGTKRIFSVEDVTVALAQRKMHGREVLDGLLRCYVCERWLDPQAFLTLTRRDKRCKPGHVWTGKSSDCRECRKQQKRESRRRKAEAAGRSFEFRGDRATWEAQRRATREQRRAEGLLRAEAHRQRQKAEAEQRRAVLAASASLECSSCRRTQPRAAFYEYELRTCKTCISDRDRLKFQRDRELLTDAYVKRQLAKHTGLVAALMPPAMIEAKRIQLMLERALPTEAERYARWLVSALQIGPVNATALNELAVMAGFSRSRLKDFKRVARRLAAYDQTTNEWRLK